MDPGPESYFIIDYDLILGFAGIIFLLALSALMSGTEVAVFSLTDDDLEKIKSSTPRKGSIIASLLNKPKKLLATVVIANTVINISIILLFFRLNSFSAISVPALRFTAEVALVTLLILLFGEVVPKVYAGRNNRIFAITMAWPLFVLSRLLAPISIPMREITLWLHKKFGKRRSDFSVDRLSQALELAQYSDATAEEQKMFEGIVSFGNTEAKQVMSPRIDIFSLDIEETFSDIFPKIVEKGFSRVPIYRENIDSIVGVLFIKDLIPYIEEKEFEWQKLMRDPFFVPENKKLDDLLKEFQTMKNHLAVVVDEYGGTSGIISLEDILEEIVGDISDEFDDEDIIYSRIDEKNFLFEGKISLKDFYRITDVEEGVFEEMRGEAETLAGFILELSGNFPKKGQKINFNGNIFTVESVDKRRIKQIKFTLK
ncbi:gliding motility-associated protein GldE [Flavobacterium rhizosphaerae]|uniref:Gliding motility-associated protein GldE n=1 Tax=Flavobacterium rhizosphaerae TaxID=3163298 RepID=A0ABW8YZJ9_9FLAO